MYVRLVHLWGARAKHAVIMRLPSYMLARRAAHFSDGITPGSRSRPPLGPRQAVLALVKTRNQFNVCNAMLELEGLGLQDGIVIGILIGGVGLLLDLQQLGFHRAALFLAL